MTTYLVSGKLGAGKTLAVVGKIREQLLRGRKVATNLDLNVEKMLGPRRRCEVMRVPDHPKSEDLIALGYGSDSVEEETFGWLVLDELGTWLNARNWQGGDRQALIDWLLHARKYRWHLVFISQHPNLVDKQIREALVEMYAVVKRLDRMNVPVISWVYKVKMPRIHVAAVKYGLEPHAPRAETWVYRARDLYGAYSTGQVFNPRYEPGLYCYLTPWHLVGRYKTRYSLRFWCSLTWRLPFYLLCLVLERLGQVDRRDYISAPAR